MRHPEVLVRVTELRFTPKSVKVSTIIFRAVADFLKQYIWLGTTENMDAVILVCYFIRFGGYRLGHGHFRGKRWGSRVESDSVNQSLR